MTATAEQLRIAEAIEMKMRQLLGAGFRDVEILAEMFEDMLGFKLLIDSSQRGEIDLNELCDRFPSFYRYSKILENFAEAMQAGAFANLGFGNRPSNDRTQNSTRR